jgi:hypothetical protein
MASRPKYGEGRFSKPENNLFFSSLNIQRRFFRVKGILTVAAVGAYFLV